MTRNPGKLAREIRGPSLGSYVTPYVTIARLFSTRALFNSNRHPIRSAESILGEEKCDESPPSRLPWFLSVVRCSVSEKHAKKRTMSARARVNLRMELSSLSSV